MKISLFQQDIAWLDPSANYQKIQRVLQDSPDTDLLVLPEMCTTGFITLPTEGQLESAEAVEQKLLAPLSLNVAVTGSKTFNHKTFSCLRLIVLEFMFISVAAIADQCSIALSKNTLNR